MERHHEKRRDMARSILPSRYRGAGRGLVQARRAHRHAIAQELRVLAAPGRLTRGWEDEVIERWDEAHDLRRTIDHEIRDLVEWRRAGDKLNPFIRWAIATTADLPVDDRLTALRATLPDGLIGDHAMSHLQRVPALRPAHDHDRSSWRVRRAVLADEQKAARAQAYRDLRTILRDVVHAPGGLRDLNAVMKGCDRHVQRRSCEEAGCVRRCLAGIHDVEAFIRDVSRHPDLDPFDSGGFVPPRIWSWEAPRLLPHRRFAAYLAALRAATERSDGTRSGSARAG